MLDDLGIPHDVLSASPAANERVETSGRTHSRPLDAEEQRGVYVLLGLLFGSWLAGSLAVPSRKADPAVGQH